ncbi:MAG: hypothetical protein HRU17_15590 [Polyangiaceae bacterium]|nr:hypothetical protein [Polyangiaceae bacterium]
MPSISRFVACLGLVMTTSSVGNARSVNAIVVELAAEVDMELGRVRRLVQLELADIGVPARLGRRRDSALVLYFRMVPGDDGDLVIELWQEGTLYGSRHLSKSLSPRLTARRAALAAGQLARQLRRKRRAAARRRHRPRRRSRRKTPPRRDSFPRPVLSASFTGAVIGPGKAWLVGPRLLGTERLSPAWNVDVGFALLTGMTIGDLELHTRRDTFAWYEASFAPSYNFELKRDHDFRLGLRAAAAVFRFSGPTEIDSMPNATESWSARAALEARYRYWSSRSFALEVGPDVGSTLRQNRLKFTDGASGTLGGLWLGLSAGIVLDPGRGRH